MKKIVIILVAIIGFLFTVIGGIYIHFSSAVDKSSNADIEVVIATGSSTADIAKILKEKGLIHNEFFFKAYSKINGYNSLKASTFLLKKNMSLKQILEVLTTGNSFNPDAVNLTFREGENIPAFATVIAKGTNNSYNEVIDIMNDKTYLQELIKTYWFLTDEILNDNIYYALEGYLAPNTYQFKSKDVTVKEIVEVMLDQMEAELSKLKNTMQNGKYSVHEYLTIASMAQLEGTNKENRAKIAGVFYNRLASNMNLGSDVTTYYALQKAMTSDLTVAEFNTANPYNTRGPGMIGKLPIGPICNPETESIEAAVNPIASKNLFFVADKNGKIYFTKTNAEHLQKVQEIKDNGDWIW